MSTTVTMPNGGKVRLASQRRYCVCVFNGRFDRWVPVFRSNVLDRAIATARKRGYREPYIVDQVEKAVVWPK